jgi:hypothetical protein
MSSHKTPLVISEHRDDPFGVWGEIFDDFIDAVIGAAPISLNDDESYYGESIHVGKIWE